MRESDMSRTFYELKTIIGGEDRRNTKIKDQIEYSFYPGQSIIGFKEAVYIKEFQQAGGFATVHLIYERAVDKYYVMKIPQAKYLKDLIHRKLFVEEAKNLAGMPAHPNLIRPIHFYELNDQPRLFTEYVEGKNLEQIINNKDTMTRNINKDEFVLSIFIEICRGLDFIYREMGLIHLDLKPANVLHDDRSGCLKVIDFGLSRSIYRSGDLKGKKAGSLPYMSPEHFKGLDYCDTRSDIYSLGVIIYRLVSGDYPFKPEQTGENIIESYESLHREKEIHSVKGCRKELEKIIIRCLKKEPERRYQTFEGLLARLESLYYKLSGYLYHDVEGEESDPDMIQSRACMKLSFGEYTSAYKLVNRALELNPEHIYSLLTKADALFYLGNSSEAQEIINKVLEKEADNTWALYIQTKISLSQFDAAEAYRCCERLKELDPDDLSNYNNLVNAYLLEGRYTEALLTIDEGLQIDPDNRDFIICKADCLRLMEKGEEAVELLQGYLSYDWDGYYYNQLGILFNNLNRHEEALKHFNKALDFDPANATYAGNMIYTLNKLNLEEAIRFAEDWASKYQASFYFYDQLGSTYISMGKREEAVECERKKLKIEPGNCYSAAKLIRYLTEIQKKKEAIDFGRKWIKQYKADNDVWYQLGEAYFKAGQLDNAIEAFFKSKYWLDIIKALLARYELKDAIQYVIDKGMTNSWFWNMLADEGKQYDNVEDTIFCYKQGLKYSGNNGEMLNNYVSYLNKKERFYEVLEISLDWGKNCTDSNTMFFINTQIAAAYTGLGQKEKAFEYYTKALNDPLTSSEGSSYYIKSAAAIFINIYEILRRENKLKDKFHIENPLVFERIGNMISSIVELEGLSAKLEDDVLMELNIEMWLNTDIEITNDSLLKKAYRYYKYELSKQMSAQYKVINIIDKFNQQNSYERAIEIGDHWIDLNRPDAEVYNKIGLSYWNNRLYDDAFEYFKKAWNIEEDNNTYAGNLVAAYRMEKEYEEGIKFAEKWLEDYTVEKSSFYKHLGQLYSSKKQYKEAYSCYKKALKMKPENDTYAFLVTDILVCQREYDEAITFGAQWQREHKESHKVLNSIGVAHNRKGLHEQAVNHYLKALNFSYSSDHPLYAGNLIYTYNKLNKYQEALSFGQEWGKKNKTSKYIDEQLKEAEKKLAERRLNNGRY